MTAKLLSIKALKKKLRALAARGKKIVFTNGCFDILHKGHTSYLSSARKLGDCLVVGLNADVSVRRLKGPDRPINNQRDRALVLAALQSVDYVTVFSEETPLKLIQELKPNILVKGGDWKKSDIVGSEFVESIGGKVKIIPYLKGFSTTGILSKIRQL